MSYNHFEKADNTESVENVEKPQQIEGNEKEGILDKAKNFFKDFGKGKETEEQKVDQADKAQEKMDERKNSFDEYVQAGGKSFDQDKQAEMGKEYRETHGLDEHGNNLDLNAKRSEGGVERERGDNGYRSRFEEDDNDSKDIETAEEKMDSGSENNTDDE
ncbi:MAG: hypothetical protein NC548_28955 [Lachnospiraceae bacterium]|nr:hypothetical protein [Lachnospiraceae bacterium]